MSSAAGDDDDEEVAVGDFFAAASRFVVTRRFVFAAGGGAAADGAPLEVSQELDCSAAASTDYDLTGQVIWPSARLLSCFIVRRLRRAALAGQDVLELGAGCGLVGLVAAHFAPRSVTLTDNEPEVLDILRRNLRHAAPGVDARCADLDWGSARAHAALAAASGGRERWRVILAADVVYWRESIAPLCATLAALLAPGDGRCYLGYFERATSNTAALERAIAEAGLAFERVPGADILLDADRADAGLERDLMCVYVIRLAGP